MSGIDPAIHALGASPAGQVSARDMPGHGVKAPHVRDVWFSETQFVACPVYWHEDLTGRTRLTGPAIIEAMDSTIVVPPGWIATVDAGGYIRLHRR